jgi:hypothetical protein
MFSTPVRCLPLFAPQVNRTTSQPSQLPHLLYWDSQWAMLAFLFINLDPSLSPPPACLASFMNLKSVSCAHWMSTSGAVPEFETFSSCLPIVTPTSPSASTYRPPPCVTVPDSWVRLCLPYVSSLLHISCCRLQPRLPQL